MNEEPSKPVILFVDDEELSRKYFKRFFAENYEVLCAENGRAGFELFRAHREEIGIVVTDQMMPEMRGIELLQNLREEEESVVRILSSAYADSEEVAIGLENGLIEFFVTKPWDLVNLEETLRQAVTRRVALAESAA
jgi:two-component system probable response regulator PhcQ